MIRSTFFIPTLLALASIAGLLIALTGEGWRDHLSSAALSIPLVATLWAFVRRT